MPFPTRRFSIGGFPSIPGAGAFAGTAAQAAADLKAFYSLTDAQFISASFTTLTAALNAVMAAFAADETDINAEMYSAQVAAATDAAPFMAIFCADDNAPATALYGGIGVQLVVNNGSYPANGLAWFIDNLTDPANTGDPQSIQLNQFIAADIINLTYWP